VSKSGKSSSVQELVSEAVAESSGLGLAAELLPGPVELPENAAARRLAELVSPAGIDRILADAEEAGVSLDGPDGLINQLTKAVVERALGVEMEDHLGYVKGDLAGNGSGNSRNGFSKKTVLTSAGPVRVEVPRDRNGEFEPKIVPKRKRRLGQIDDMILSLYARGMTTRDIAAHLEEVYGASVSPELVSRVTDVVTDEITAWQTRPTERVYPICYIDAIVVKIRTEGVVSNRPAYIVTGVDAEGVKHVLGIWIGPSEGEGASYWMSVLNELRNRGTEDVLIVCCDGLKGLPEAIVTVWPKTIVQTCVVHLIRNSMKFVSYGDRKAVAKALKPIYTAVNEVAAQTALDHLRQQWGKKYPGLIDVWERAWDRFIPFLEFHPAIRKVIYTTNTIESINYQLRKVTKTRGHFPTEEAAMKLLYLGIRNITGRHIDGEGRIRDQGLRGTGTYGWKNALNAFAVRFGDRLPI
jgi:putative transposase